MGNTDTSEAQSTIMPFDSAASVDKALEDLRGLLTGSEGFVLVAIANKDGKTGVATIGGGNLYKQQITELCVASVQFGRKIYGAARPDPCDCPACTAQNFADEAASTTTH